MRLLGGIEKPIPAYGAVGYDGVTGSAKVAEEWAKRGFSGIKAKIGYPTVQEDVEVIRAIRSAVGSSVAMMADYNQCLTPSEAVQRLRLLDDEGLTWVEEPTLAHDYAGHAFIARETKTPIQCGENWWGTLDMQHAIDAQASDFMMPDVMKIGGVTGLATRSSTCTDTWNPYRLKGTAARNRWLGAVILLIRFDIVGMGSSPLFIIYLRSLFYPLYYHSEVYDK